MSNDSGTAATPTTSVPADYSSSEAMKLGEERRAERTRFRQEAARMVEEEKQKAAAPRLRAKARAEEAAIVAIESLGVHDPLVGFDSFRAARENIHKSVVATFQAMARTFDSEQLSGPQGIAEVAKIGRETLDKYLGQINDQRNSLHRIRGDVEERVKNAMTPPPHLARMVEQARDALRTMPEKERNDLIANARGEDSTVLMYAVGGAPAFLTGVAEGQRKQKRDTLIAVRDYELLALESNLPKAFAAADKMEAGITRLMNSVVDFNAAQALSDLRKA